VPKLCPGYAFLPVLACLAYYEISNLLPISEGQKNESLSLRHLPVHPGESRPEAQLVNAQKGAGALAKQGIKLELYFHPGHDDAPWWQRTHFNDDKAAYFELWCEVIRDVGERYGKRLAGFWFDDAAFTYYPHNPPWEKMTAAAKAGNGERLITYNSWILPRLNDFYEVFAGENEFSETVIDGDGYLPAGGTGKFTGGPQKGLQGQITTIVNGDWGHFKRNTPIGPPRYSTEVMIAKIKEAIERRNVPLLDIEVYQDGTISPETFQMFLAIRREIKPASIERDRSLPGSASLRLRWAK
jgi:hypothetical protein